METGSSGPEQGGGGNLKLTDDTLVQVVKRNHDATGVKGYAFNATYRPRKGRRQLYRVLRIEGGVLGWFTRSQLKRIPETA